MLDREQLAKDNVSLIYSFMYKKHLNYDDWYGPMAVAYMRAVNSYDPEGGATFGSYAYQAMHFELIHSLSLRDANKIARSIDGADPKECRIVSLNVKTMDEEDSPELLDLVADPKDHYGDILDDLCFKLFYSQLTERDKQIVDYRLDGMDLRAIGRALSISHERVRQRIIKMRETFDASFGRG